MKKTNYLLSIIIIILLIFGYFSFVKPGLDKKHAEKRAELEKEYERLFIEYSTIQKRYNELAKETGPAYREMAKSLEPIMSDKKKTLDSMETVVLKN